MRLRVRVFCWFVCLFTYMNNELNTVCIFISSLLLLYIIIINIIIIIQKRVDTEHFQTRKCSLHRDYLLKFGMHCNKLKHEFPRGKMSIKEGKFHLKNSKIFLMQGSK